MSDSEREAIAAHRSLWMIGPLNVIRCHAPVIGACTSFPTSAAPGVFQPRSGLSDPGFVRDFFPASADRLELLGRQRTGLEQLGVCTPASRVLGTDDGR